MANVEIKITTPGAEDAGRVFRGLADAAEGFGGTLRRVLETATGFTLATSFQQLAVQAASFGRELVQLGLETVRQEEAFRRMTQAMGVNGPGLIQAFEEASRGIVDVSNVMTTAVKGMQQSLSESQLVDIMRIATAQSQLMGTTVADAFNQITTAIVNNQEKGLKSAGIVVDLQQAYQDYAASLGTTVDKLNDTTKAQVALWAVQDSTRQAVAQLNQETLTMSQQTEKAEKAWIDFKQTLGVGIVQAMGGVIASLQTTAPLIESFAENLFKSRDALYAWLGGASKAAAEMAGFRTATAEAAPAIERIGTALADVGEDTDRASHRWQEYTQRQREMRGELGPTTEDLKRLASETERTAKAAEEAARVVEAWRKAVGQVGVTAAFIYDDVERLRTAMEFEDLEASVRAAEAWEKAVGQVGITAALIYDDVERIPKAMGNFDEVAAAVTAAEAWEKAVGKAGLTAALIYDDVERLPKALGNFDEVSAAVAALEAWEKAVGQAGITAALIYDDVERLPKAFGNFDEVAATVTAIEDWERAVGQAGLTAALIYDDVSRLPKALGNAEEVEAGLRAWDDFGKGVEKAFLSVLDTGDKLVTGLIQGTLDIGDAFTDLGQKLLANFVNVIIHEVFDDVLSAAASFVTSLVQILFGGGGSMSGAWTSLVADLGNTFLGGLFGGGVGGGGISPNANVPFSGQPGMGPWNTGAGGVGGGFSLGNILSGGSLLSGIANIGTGIQNFIGASFTGASSIGDVVQNAMGQIVGSTIGKISGLVGTAISLYQGVMAAIEGRPGAAAGTFGGMAIGAGAGFLLGGPWGAALGAGLGGGLGNILGGLFDEDWEAIRRDRSRQRQLTGATGLGQMQDILLEQGTSFESLVDGLKQSFMGTPSTIGGVLATMVRDIQSGFMSQVLEGQPEFNISSEALSRIGSFLQQQGITPEQFTSGRVSSVAELIAATGGEKNIQGGVEAWSAFLTALDAIIPVMEETGLTLGEVLEPTMLKWIERAMAFNEIVDRIPHGPAKVDLSALVGLSEEQMQAAAKVMIDQLVDAIMEAPQYIVAVLDFEALKREGETAAEAFDRITQSLADLGAMAKSFDVEMLALSDPLGAATLGFQQTIDAIEGADWEGMLAKLESADPTDWATAVADAHALLIARYEAIIALSAAISETTGQLYDLGATFTGVLAQFGISAADVGIGLTAFIESLPTAESKLIGLGGSVQMFADQVSVALQTMDPAQIQAGVEQWGVLLGGFYNTFAAIQQIEDPTIKAQMLQQLIADMNNAAGAIIDAITGIVQFINQSAASIAQAGSAVASNADWLAKAGVDIGALATDMLGLIELFPTFAARIDLLKSGIDLFIAGLGEGMMEKLKQWGMQFENAPAGSEQQRDIGLTIANALEPVLTGIVNSFEAAMALQNPGERLAALTQVMETIGTLLGSLPPEVADALTTMFGPEVQLLVTEIKNAAAQQAEAAKAAADELEKIIGQDALNAENFLLKSVSGIKEAMDLIITGAGPLFREVFQEALGTGSTFMGAIETAGVALSGALGTFTSAADQLKFSIEALKNEMYQKVYDGVYNAVIAAIPTSQHGTAYTHQGLYYLHQGERVLTAEQNRGYSGAPSVSLTFTGPISVGGGSREDARQFLRHLEEEVATGSLGRTIARRVGAG